MQLISTELGRVVRLVPIEEIRPFGGVHSPSAFRMITDRYSFGYTPDLRRPWEEVQKEGLKFQLGKLVHGNKPINITDFTLYADGIVVTSTSTDDAELFLADVMAWGKEVFGFRDTSSGNTRTLYLSQLIVDFESSPNSLLTNFGILSEKLGKLLQETYGIDVPVQLSILGLNYDRTTVVPAWQNVAQFLLDRRINQPYSTNRFFSEAPLRTQDHLQFLQTIESTLTTDGRLSQKKGK